MARIITGIIKLKGNATGNITTHGLHLHHFLWGLILIIGVALYGFTDRSHHERSWMGIVFGIGLALVVDEAALLVTLRDVYWQASGWSSVGAAIMLISMTGTALFYTRSGRQPAACHLEAPSAADELRLFD